MSVSPHAKKQHLFFCFITSLSSSTLPSSSFKAAFSPFDELGTLHCLPLSLSDYFMRVVASLLRRVFSSVPDTLSCLVEDAALSFVHARGTSWSTRAELPRLRGPRGSLCGVAAVSPPICIFSHFSAARVPFVAAAGRGSAFVSPDLRLSSSDSRRWGRKLSEEETPRTRGII